jgi:hypothetical protein
VLGQQHVSLLSENGFFSTIAQLALKHTAADGFLTPSPCTLHSDSLTTEANARYG